MNDESEPSTRRLEPLASGAEGLVPLFAISDAITDRMPDVLGRSARFDVIRLLGRGAFGEVYLAQDRQLSRQVAIKVARTDRFSAPEQLEAFVREARATASLKHPGIVTVYDVRCEKDGVFIVLEFVEGCTLAEYIGREERSLDQVVRLMIEVAQAVAYAHEQGLVHRDLKPSNILVDAQRKIRITDFGLAIDEQSQRDAAREVVGTPLYMAPEQVRAETHRVDGRTDVWSLGVILYWLLTGRRPFDGTNHAEIYDAILRADPRPPRQMRPSVPRELERICLKSLSKRMTERYATARDLADELHDWLRLASELPSNPTASTVITSDAQRRERELSIVPKGLRSYDRNDADFYLNLLPGPYDRQGLPESVRFWKHQVEERDAVATFSVGLMYGPSGCGKTSLVRAGILPRLDANVRSVYMEATPENFELRLLGAILRALDQPHPELSLTETLIAIRAGRLLQHNEKLLLVLDQFEQWLTGREIDVDDELVQALRQCDGSRLQCLVMIRDDFSMAATRFMNALEVPMLEGHNCRAVDMFRPEHARTVLHRFGEAFGKLPVGEGEKPDQFVHQAIELLSDGNSVAPVRLAAFAELTRQSDWNSATLRRLRSKEGLGLALLDTYLGDEVSNLTHRQHRTAARRVLEALLPDDRTALKGRMRSQSELMVISGYADRPRDFATLMNMLDKELRLISAADPEQDAPDGSTSGISGSSRTERYFQLAHDYLVPALNAWLTAKQRESRAGRAKLLLETISTDWNARPDARRLPSFMEWLSIRFLTQYSNWSTPQRRMMAAATRRHVARASMIAASIAVGIAAISVAQSRQRAQLREGQDRATADQLLVADVSRVPDLLRELDTRASPTARALLESAAAKEQPDADKRLRAQLFIAPQSQAARESLLTSLLAAGPAEHRLITGRLASNANALAPALWQELAHTDSVDRIVRAAAALATWNPDNAAWSQQSSRIAEALSQYDNPYQLPTWVDSLAPLGDVLAPALSAQFRVEGLSSSERTATAIGLVRFLRGDVAALVPLVVDAGPDTFPIFLTELQRHSTTAITELGKQWSVRELPTDAAERARDVRRRTVAAMALARLGSSQALWSALRGDATPDIRTSVMDGCASYGISGQDLLDHVDSETNSSGRQAALIILGEYGRRLSPKTASQLVDLCLRLYEHDTVAGVHSGAEYVLNRLEEQSKLADRRASAATQPKAASDWMVNSQGVTMLVLRGPHEFDQGSPNSETERAPNETLKRVRLPHSFAISAHEITAEQFKRFQPDFPLAQVVTPSPQCPASNVTWLDAVKYCRWLSETEEIPEAEMCYPPIAEIEDDFQPAEGWQQRRGYRLPTESEWECACRAGTQTARFFGETGDRLDRYAVYNANSQDRLRPVGSLRPNPWGLFDVYGNVLEWCQDATSVHGFDLSSDQTDRILRGGSYRWVERELRSARRVKYHPTDRYAFLGLRVARTIHE